MAMAHSEPILGMPSTMADNANLYLKKLFDRGMCHQPDTYIITHTFDGNTHRMKYKDFRTYTLKLASALYSKYNIYIGETVSTFMWNSIRHMSLYYTIPCIGSVLNPLNIRLHETELAYIISHSQPKVIFIDENLFANFEKVLNVNPLPTVRAFIICGDHMQRPTYFGKHPLLKNRVIDFDELISVNTSVTNNFKWPINLDEKSGCFLNYTSGTTGNPKGIINSHRSTSLRTLLELSRYSSKDCILGLPPMFHACGWGMPFIAMTNGAKIVLNNTCYNYNILMDLILNERITRICGVPTMIEDMCNKLKENPNKYASIRNCVSEIRCGGAVCPPYIIKYLFDEWNIEVSHGWGMTECMPGCHSKRLQRRRDLQFAKSGNENRLIQNQLKQGTFNASMEFTLDNIQSNNNGDMIGELLIKGPCITSSYYKMDSETHNKYFTKDGYLLTGDIVSISPVQEMTIVDRSKDLIKTGGEWIASLDMENYVMKLGISDKRKYENNIKLCAVVAQPHPRWNERPILIIERSDKQNLLQPSVEEIITHLKQKYAKFQIVDDILFWDSIPLTGTGKKSKKNIRNKLKEQNYILPQLRTTNTKSKL